MDKTITTASIVFETGANKAIDTLITSFEKQFIHSVSIGDFATAQRQLDALTTMHDKRGHLLSENIPGKIEIMQARLHLAQMKALTIAQIQQKIPNALDTASKGIMEVQAIARTSNKPFAKSIIDLSATTLREIMFEVNTIRTETHTHTIGAIQKNSAVAPYIADYSTTVKTIESVGALVTNDDEIQGVVHASQQGFEEAITAYTTRIADILKSDEELSAEREADYEAVSQVLEKSHQNLATTLRMTRIEAEAERGMKIPETIKSRVTTAILSPIRALLKETGSPRGIPLLQRENLHRFEAFLASFIEQHAKDILPLIEGQTTPEESVIKTVVQRVLDVLETEYKAPTQKALMTIKESEIKAAQATKEMSALQKFVYVISAEDIRANHNAKVKKDNAQAQAEYQAKVEKFKAMMSGDGNAQSLSLADLNYVLHLAKTDPLEIQKMSVHLSEAMTKMQDPNQVPTIIESLEGIDPKTLEILLTAGFSGSKINRDGFVLFCHAMDQKIGKSFLDSVPELKAMFMKELNTIQGSICRYLKNIKSQHDDKVLSSLVNLGKGFVTLLDFMSRLNLETSSAIQDIQASWHATKDSLGTIERDTASEFYSVLTSSQINKLSEKLTSITMVEERLKKAFAVRVWSGDSKTGVVQPALAA